MIFHHTPDGPNPVCPSLTRTAAEPVQCLGSRCAVWSPRFTPGERVTVPNADKVIHVLKSLGACGLVGHTATEDDDSVLRGLILRADLLARLGAVRITPRSIVAAPLARTLPPWANVWNPHAGDRAPLPAAPRPSHATSLADGHEPPAQPAAHVYDPGDDPI